MFQQALNDFKNMPIEISENKEFQRDLLVRGTIQDWEAEVQKFKDHFDSADRIAQNTPAMKLLMSRKKRIEDFLKSQNA
ncbi:hypothetical protein CY0110_15030 [Crocosphaera chwakensis CCY0110]|uniref:Uncharacterized protein n=2 Tax=Crocosphaera TaxID=263510 RepID=A3ITX5_9CHRO|nr:hypothetical protein CY0110_15030 [Crocosphaera chwakensis CCY0110]